MNVLLEYITGTFGILSTQALILSLGVTSVANSQSHADRVYKI